MSPQTLLYKEAIACVNRITLIDKKTKQDIPQQYIVATHGPTLMATIKEDPRILDMIGIYRVNCSHLGKESNWEALGDFLRTIHPFCKILIDLQWPKPRIQELEASLWDKIVVTLGKKFKISFASEGDSQVLCTEDHLKVCFPQIVDVMSVGDLAVFDDGKMTATVREVHDDYKVIECTEIGGGKESYNLKGRKGICIRNKPLGIDCITEHDHKSLEFACDMVGFDCVDNIMVSYFLHPQHIEDFKKIVREEYHYTGNLGAKFETPFAVNNVDEILSHGDIRLAMFGRGDLRVEMDLRAIKNMHDIQVYFFEACKKYGVESICATGFLESMMTPDGLLEASEINDMQISMRTGADHLMLSAESSYGPQARKCVETECAYQRDIWNKLEKNAVEPHEKPEETLSELLYLS